MQLFDVYPRYDITFTKAKGVYLYDEKGLPYLDLYGGHGVISIGHSHPEYVKRLTEQLNNIGYYSNSVQIPIQDELAKKLGQLSGYSDYQLFLCNSGAEANENALKVASFHTGKKKVIAFKKSFHGRTAAALNVTDNPNIQAPINQNNFPVEFIELNNEEQLKAALANDDVCAVIVEGIQGVGGLDLPSPSYLEFLSRECNAHGAMLVLDEIQSGYGRSGKFFAHQYANVRPDIITTAKGMGNGFPLAGVLIQPKIQAKHGMLGTTFGGNQLACAAGVAVLDVLENEKLIENADKIGAYISSELKNTPGITQVKGLGLMLGVELEYPVKELRLILLTDYRIMTGASANPNLLRILPPLGITAEEVEPFISALKKLI